MEYEEKIIRAKKRVEYLRRIHGLKKKDVYSAFGFSKQHYYEKYHNSTTLSVRSLVGITNLFGISEHDLLHATEEEFNELPIVKAYLEYSKTVVAYEKLKLGIWVCEPFIKSGTELSFCRKRKG